MVLLLLLSVQEVLTAPSGEGARKGNVFTVKSQVDRAACPVSSTAAPGAMLGSRGQLSKVTQMKEGMREGRLSDSLITKGKQ